MTRRFAVLLLAAFVLSLGLGLMSAPVQAGPGPGCWFECQDGNTYYCCLAPRPPYELRCTFVHYGC